MNENCEATALNIEKSINNSWATSWNCDSLHDNFSCFVPAWPNLDFFQLTSRKALQCLQPWPRVGLGQALNGRCLVVNYAPNPLPQWGVCVCVCVCVWEREREREREKERERENVSTYVASQLDWNIQASWVLQCFSFVMGFGVIEHSRLIYQRRQWHPLQYPCLENSMDGGAKAQCMGSLTEQLHFYFSLSCFGEGNGNPLQCSCLENPRDEEPAGLPSMGSHRVGHNWSDLAAAGSFISLEHLFCSSPSLFTPGPLWTRESYRVDPFPFCSNKAPS